MKQIFVHGLGQTPASWDQTIEKLGAGETALCPDLAKLTCVGDASYPHLYTAFSAVCDSCEERLDLCGLSLGGVLALQYAIDHPQKVRSLALLATQYRMPKALLRVQNIVFRLMPQSMFQQTGFGKAEFLRLCQTMMELDFSPFLAQIACPVLVVCGEKDSANKAASRELAGRLRAAELCLLEGAGHELNTEAPERLAKLLRRFYEKIGSGQA